MSRHDNIDAILDHLDAGNPDPEPVKPEPELDAEDHAFLDRLQSPQQPRQPSRYQSSSGEHYSTEAEFYNNDPLGYSAQLASQQQQQINQLTAQGQARDLRDFTNTEVSNYRSSHPEYDGALSHYIESRTKEMQTMGVPESRIQNAIQQEAMGIAATAQAQGKNPAAVLSELSRVRGFDESAHIQNLDGKGFDDFWDKKEADARRNETAQRNALANYNGEIT